MFRRYTKNDYLFKKGVCVQVPKMPKAVKPHIVISQGLKVSKFRSPSLDIYTQISTRSLSRSNSDLSKKQKRVYASALSGVKRAMGRRKNVFFLTLTSAVGSGNKLAVHWDLLVKRIRRELNYKFEYMKVETSEGNGVIHALFHSAFDGWKYDAIHAYLSVLWQELHNSPIVWCTSVGHSVRSKICGYMMQYVSKQTGFLRQSCSLNWIFKGWRKKMIDLIKKFGFIEGIKVWNSVLRFFSGQVVSSQIILNTS